MLPFLKPKSITGLIISKRSPDADITEQHSEGNEDAELDQCSEDLLRAITAQDAKGVSAALRSAFEFLDTPESEGSGTYDEQNALAAKEQG